MRFDDSAAKEERWSTNCLAPFRMFLKAWYRQMYSLTEYLTFHETPKAFRGRCEFMQYMPKNQLNVV